MNRFPTFVCDAMPYGLCRKAFQSKMQLNTTLPQAQMSPCWDCCFWRIIWVVCMAIPGSPRHSFFGRFRPLSKKRRHAIEYLFE